MLEKLISSVLFCENHVCLSYDITDTGKLETEMSPVELFRLFMSEVVKDYKRAPHSIYSSAYSGGVCAGKNSEQNLAVSCLLLRNDNGMTNRAKFIFITCLKK